MISLLRDVFGYLDHLRVQDPLAKHIQYPKLPSLLSESIVLNSLKEGALLPELATASFAFGGRRADIMAQLPDGNEQTIEVKATGKSAFQYFGKKDIGCDFLVWVNFGTYFHARETQPVEACVIHQPSRYFRQPLKVTLAKVKSEVPVLQTCQIEIGIDQTQ